MASGLNNIVHVQREEKRAKDSSLGYTRVKAQRRRHGLANNSTLLPIDKKTFKPRKSLLAAHTSCPQLVQETRKTNTIKRLLYVKELNPNKMSRIHRSRPFLNPTYQLRSSTVFLPEAILL